MFYWLKMIYKDISVFTAVKNLTNALFVRKLLQTFCKKLFKDALHVTKCLQNMFI